MGDRFILRGPGNAVLRELQRARPRERRVEYAERLISSVDGGTPELAGSGERLPGPIEIDCSVEPPPGVWWSRTRAARELGRFLADVEQTVRVTFGDLSLPVSRVRCVSRQGTGRGYRLTLRLYSGQHEFQDATGLPVPLA